MFNAVYGSTADEPANLSMENNKFPSSAGIEHKSLCHLSAYLFSFRNI
jgi:hypothetical protein